MFDTQTNVCYNKGAKWKKGNTLKEKKMTEERKQQIENFANKTGLSFVDAKRMLEEIEADDFSYEQTMAEIAY